MCILFYICACVSAEGLNNRYSIKINPFSCPISLHCASPLAWVLFWYQVFVLMLTNRIFLHIHLFISSSSSSSTKLYIIRETVFSRNIFLPLLYSLLCKWKTIKLLQHYNFTSPSLIICSLLSIARCSLYIHTFAFQYSPIVTTRANEKTNQTSNCVP